MDKAVPHAQPPSNDELRARRLLMGIVVVAFLVRVANLLWGIPVSVHTAVYHGDEPKAWTSVVDFPECYWGSSSYLYGTTLQYAIGTLLLPVKALLVWGL